MALFRHGEPHPDGEPFVPAADITKTLPDGRVIVLAAAGVPVPYGRAVQAGFIKKPAIAGPGATSETKAAADSANATKAAAELAAREGIDLGTIEATGVGGKIIVSDVERALQGDEEEG